MLSGWSLCPQMTLPWSLGLLSQQIAHIDYDYWNLLVFCNHERTTFLFLLQWCQLSQQAWTVTTKGTFQTFRCGIKKEIHIILCQTSPKIKEIWSVILHIWMHPLICVHHLWFTLVMFNIKYYLGKWYYHKNAHYHPPPSATDFLLHPTWNFLDSPWDSFSLV